MSLGSLVCFSSMLSQPLSKRKHYNQNKTFPLDTLIKRTSWSRSMPSGPPFNLLHLLCCDLADWASRPSHTVATLVASTTGEVPTHSWNPWIALLTKYSSPPNLGWTFPKISSSWLFSITLLPPPAPSFSPQRLHLETVEYVKSQLFLFCSLLGEERVESHGWLHS